MLKIEQGIIINYHDSNSPRTCDVLQLPDNYVMSNVRLPHTINWQTKPLINSVVLVVSPDNYKSFVLCVLRDAEDFLELGEGLRGEVPATATYLQPGEVMLEAAGSGDGTDPISGTSGTIFIANDGTINMHSGKRKEYLILGGTDDDEDGEVLLVGDNGFFESNVNHITQVRNFYRFDKDNLLTLGNELTLVTPVAEVSTVISQLEMTPLGKVTIENRALGVPTSSIELAVNGTITIKNVLSTQEITTLGAYSFTNPTSSITLTQLGDYTVSNPISTFNMASNGNISLQNAIAQFNAQSSGAITIDGTTINLNNGTFGVARLNDATIVNALTDPAFMSYLTLLDTFMAAIFTTYNTHTHIYVDTPVGPSVTAIPLPLMTVPAPTHPSSVIGKVNAASSTVKAGG